MPELPEVETVKLGLAKLLPGHTIKAVTHDWPRSFPNNPNDVNAYLVGAKVNSVKRRGKVLIIELDSNYALVIHLKMTGQLVYRGDGGDRFGAGHPSDSLIGELPDKSTRVTLELDGAKLFFNDQRKFGWVRLLPSAEVMEMEFFKKLGPEPLEPTFTWQVLRDRLKRRPGTSIKAALLDQSVLAGVGNIYADEALYAAKIHPATLVSRVSAAKLKLLHEALVAVLKLSIEKGGSSDRNYVNAEGKKGSYLTFAKVFRLEGQPCPRCGALIQKMRVAGRGTHFCKVCQKITA